MDVSEANLVLVHGPWADASSWNDPIGPLPSGVCLLTAVIQLTSLSVVVLLSSAAPPT
jgi:hypothetical protein